MKVAALIPAAGEGKRMGYTLCKKPYISIKGYPILFYVLDILEQIPKIEQIIIAVSPRDEKVCKRDIIDRFSFKKVTNIVSGGKRRQDSVRNMLQFLSKDVEIVLIHDGARPLITKKLVQASINATEKWGATVLAVPAKDTIKFADKDRFVETTPCREKIWCIQTPQTFRRDVIVDAYKRAYEGGFMGTDDASLVERIGIKVKIIMGSYENIKITTPEDLFIAERIIKERERHTI